MALPQLEWRQLCEHLERWCVRVGVLQAYSALKSSTPVTHVYSLQSRVRQLLPLCETCQLSDAQRRESKTQTLARRGLVVRVWTEATAAALEANDRTLPK